MTRVKICGITTVTDACLAIDAGANAIGLNFCASSPRCVSLAAAEEIARVVPEGVWRVGVFVNAPREQILQTIKPLGLDAIQLHGEESPEMCSGWDCKVIKAVRVRAADTLARAAAEYAVDLILADAHVEGARGGTGKRVPVEWLAGVDRNRLILAGGLDPENVADAVRRLRPFMVDVASGVEAALGRKDPERMKRFIANAKSA